MAAEIFAKQIINGIIYGDQNFSVPPHANCGAFALQKILEHKDKVAVTNGETGEHITYRELALKIVSVATSLIELGIKKGDTVAILSKNRIEYMITSIAVFCCGGIITFYNIAYAKDELIHAANISKPKYMFISGEAYKTHYEVLNNIGCVSKFIIYDDLPNNKDCLRFQDLSRRNVDVNSYKPVDFKGTNKTCMILYTSGTTGLAKGAKITHFSLITIFQQPLMTSRHITPLSVAPWSSTMGQLCGLQEIVFGRHFVFLPTYEERLYIKTIEKYKIGILAVAPPLIVMLCKSTIVKEYDISSVEVIYVGGAPTNPSVILQLKNRFPHIKHVLQGYGITEATGLVTLDREIAPKEGSVGRVARGIVVKVADPDTNKIVGIGEPGEVRVKGMVVFDGYLGKEMKDEYDDDGFYKTGDIAYFDKEGYFYIVDRIKELIKYKAWQVPPSELEALLLQHPAIKEAGVTGAPDLLAGELPTAFVVRQPGAKVTEKEIIDYVGEKVAPWKRLRGGVKFLDEIPKTSSGKILRRKLKALLPKNNPNQVPLSKL